MLFAVAALWLAAALGRLPAQGPWRTSGPAYPQVETIALVPGDEAVVYASARDPESSTSALFRSQDGGFMWTLLAQAPFQASVRQVAIDPTGTQRLLAITENAVGHEFVYRSEDGGVSWVQTGLFPADEGRSVFFDPVAPDTAYLVGGGRLARSEAGGGWERIADAYTAWVSPEGALFWGEIIPPQYPFCPGFFCYPEDALLVSANQGRVPGVVGPGVHLHSNTVAYAPGNSSVVYAASESEPFLASGDGGGNWAPVAHGDSTGILGSVPERRVARIAVDPLDAATIFLTAVSTDPADGLLLRSEDGGVHWTRVPVPESPTGPLAIGPTSRVLFVGTVQGIYRLPLGRTQTLLPR
jgi:hypothetical protein